MAEKLSEVEAKLPQPVVCGEITFTIYNERVNVMDRDEKVDEIDLLSSLLTGTEAKEIVLFKEENFTFDIALATARNNSWDGIHHGHFPNFAEKQLKSVELCSQMGRKQHISEIQILNRITDMLKTPAPPFETKKAGKVVWYQYPWSERGPSIKEAIHGVKDQQEKGDYLLLGSLCITSKKSGINNIRIDQRFVDHKSPSYSFLGVDKKFVKKLVSYGYCNQGWIGFDEEEDQKKADKHLILVFQKK